MRKRRFLKFAAASFFAFFLFANSTFLHAQTTDAGALSGKVSSAEEGAMEGVLVGARRVGATFSLTVVSDQHGKYRFPRSRMEPGQYTLRTRAAGYDLVDPGPLEITAGKSVVADLKLIKTKDLASQLTSAEWLASFPGTDEQKNFFYGCMTCHTLERIAKSHYDVDGWMAIYQRMSTYFPEDAPYRPQKRVYPSNGFGDPQRLRKQAEWMATINLSKVDTWAYPLKTLPRPKGRATRVIITEYDLPRKDSVPHDLVLASSGDIWYDDSGWQFLGKLDSKTGHVTEYPVPTFNQDFPLGMLDLQKDKDGNLWPAMMDQGKLMKFDIHTLQFKFWDLPKEENLIVQQINFLMPYHSDVDGKVWTNDMNIGEVRRLDLKTGHVDLLKVLEELPGGAKGHGFYDFAADSKNNGYLLDIGGGTIIKVDARTTQVSMFPTPTPASGPRRGTMDSQDRLWFGEYRGNRIAMFDTRTEKFKEWIAPIPWTAPYGAMLDDKGDVWSAGITTDRVQRWDPKSGQVIDYLMPRYASLRRMDLDNSSTHTILWAVNKNSASIIKVEPLD